MLQFIASVYDVKEKLLSSKDLYQKEIKGVHSCLQRCYASVFILICSLAQVTLFESLLL